MGNGGLELIDGVPPPLVGPPFSVGVPFLGRDHLAAMAMQGLMAAGSTDIPENYAAAAYLIADAMLAERKKATP